jgi:LmbE family N-acetylglucosaminyl deacetylase
MREVTPSSTTSPAWRALLSRSVPVSVADAFRLSAPARVMFLGAHPDDETFAAGATLAGLARAGHHIHVATMSAGEAALDGVEAGAGDLAATRRAEFAQAVGELGVTSWSIGDLPDGGLLGRIDDVRTTAQNLVLDLEPDVVLTTWWNDPHPDHQAVGLVARHIAVGRRVPAYGFPIWAHHWMRPQDAPALPLLTVLRHDEEDRACRHRAIAAYASQTTPPRADVGAVLPPSFLEWDIEYCVDQP